MQYPYRSILYYSNRCSKQGPGYATSVTRGAKSAGAYYRANQRERPDNFAILCAGDHTGDYERLKKINNYEKS